MLMVMPLGQTQPDLLWGRNLKSKEHSLSLGWDRPQQEPTSRGFTIIGEQ